MKRYSDVTFICLFYDLLSPLSPVPNVQNRMIMHWKPNEHLLIEADENHEKRVTKIVVPLKLKGGTSRKLVRTLLLQKSASFIPVYWKGTPTECTLELHCYTNLFGTFRSTGRGHLQACQSVPVQICSLHSAQTVKANSHKACRAHAASVPLRVQILLLSEAYQSQMQLASALNCWTSSSDISGYHADFHEGHVTVRACQGDGMACVN